MVMCKQSDGWIGLERVLCKAEFLWEYAISERLMTSRKGVKVEVLDEPMIVATNSQKKICRLQEDGEIKDMMEGRRSTL